MEFILDRSIVVPEIYWTATLMYFYQHILRKTYAKTRSSIEKDEASELSLGRMPINQDIGQLLSRFWHTLVWHYALAKRVNRNFVILRITETVYDQSHRHG